MGADPTWPNRARYSIPCAVTLGSGGGGCAAGRHSRLGRAQRRSGFGRAAVVRFVAVFSPYLYRCCSCFPSVCCSVKLPLSRPTSFCLFLPILLRTPEGGGAAAWRFCCRRQPKPKQYLLNPGHLHAEEEQVLYSMWTAVLAPSSSLSLPAPYPRGARGGLLPEPERKWQKPHRQWLGGTQTMVASPWVTWVCPRARHRYRYRCK